MKPIPRLLFGKIFLILFVLSLKYVPAYAQNIDELVLRESYREAIQKYEGKKSTPSESYLLGICYREIKETKKAESIWSSLLSGPEKERSLLALAHLKSAEGFLTESEKLFRKFSADFPESQYQPSALLGLSEVLSRKNKTEGFQGSLNILTTLRQRYPLSPEAKQAIKILNRELGPYTIQIGSFSSFDRAEKVTGDLRSKGYEAYVVRTTNGLINYKVRIGNFKNEKEANKKGKILKTKTGLDYFITK